MNLRKILVCSLVILMIILLLRHFNCKCVEGFNTDNQDKKKIKNKLVLKSKIQYHDNEEYNNLINQVIRAEKHDVDKVRNDNIKMGVKQDHPFVSLPRKRLKKYLVTYPNTKEPKNRKTKRNIEPFTSSQKTYTNNINHEIGDIRNQGLIGNCWGIAIVEAIDSAYYNETGNIFKTSIQQLMDCLVDLDVDYNEIYISHPFLNSGGDPFLLIIQNFYRDSQKKIYSEVEYPSILENCYIPYDVRKLIFCSECNDYYDYHEYYDRMSDDKTDRCDINIEDNTPGFSCEADLCNDCRGWGFCEKSCGFCSDNICNDDDNNGCDTFLDSNGNTCTHDINNRCIQECRTDINPSENITVRDVILLDNINDKNIYNNLLTNTLVCNIFATDDMMYFDSTDCYIIFDENSDTDPNLYWNPDTIENNDPNISDLDNNTCLDYNYGVGRSPGIAATRLCCSPDDEGIIDYKCNDEYFGINTPFCQKTNDSDQLYRDLDIIRQKNCDGNWISDPATEKITWEQQGEFCKNTCRKKSYDWNHVVIIVGSIYKSNKTLPTEKQSTSGGRYFWKIRNSWGNEWGDNGHFYVERDVNDERFNGNASLLSINSMILYVTLNIE